MIRRQDRLLVGNHGLCWNILQLTSCMIFILITALLLVLELLYLKIALRFNISDTPNLRSSHTIVTLRGGGVIFPISALVYFLFFGFHYFGFILGLLAVSAFSFANDIKHQSRTLRMIVQMIAVSIFFWRMNLVGRVRRRLTLRWFKARRLRTLSAQTRNLRRIR